MKKYGWKLILIVILALIVSIYLLKAPLFSSYLTSKMGVRVLLESIDIGESKTKIKNFHINNPKGFKREAAFKVKETEINYNFHHLFRDPIEFDLITLDGVYLNIQVTDLKNGISNWTNIGFNENKTEDVHNKKVIIHKLVLTNISVEVSGLGSVTGLTVPKKQHFDRWEFNEISSEHGFPTKDLIAKIFGQAGVWTYVKGIFKQAVKTPKTLNPLRLFGISEEMNHTEQSP